MKAKHKRLLHLVILLAVLGSATMLVMNAFKENVQFFYSPTELRTKVPLDGRLIRFGGMVEEGSLVRYDDSTRVTFRITDFKTTVPVSYEGILPDLFKEKSGAIMTGRLQSDGSFLAINVLAKHDEKYMPPEIADTLHAPQPQGQEPSGESP